MQTQYIHRLTAEENDLLKKLVDYAARNLAVSHPAHEHKLYKIKESEALLEKLAHAEIKMK